MYGQTILYIESEGRARDTLLCEQRQALQDSIEARLRQELFAGYLSCGIDSFFCKSDSSSCTLRLDLGPRFSAKFYLEQGNVPDLFYQPPGRQKGLGLKELEKEARAILRKAENKGYPFATLQPELLSVSQDSIRLRWFWQSKQLVLWQPLRLEKQGDTAKLRLHPKYLESYLGISAKRMYNEQQVQELDKRLADLPFVESFAPSQVLFQGNEAELHLFLKNKQASRFDIVFGLMPSQDIQGQGTRLQFTGNILLDLQNSFGRGEQFYLSWRQLQQGISEFETKAQWPYLFSSPFGLQGALQIYRRDSSYVDIIGRLAIQYKLDGKQEISAYWQDLSTNVLQPDTGFIRRTSRLPELSDTKSSFFGLDYHFEKLDYRRNPRKGLEYRLSAAFGRKRLRPHIQVLEMQGLPFEPERLYDTLLDARSQYRLEQLINYYIPLGQLMSLRLQSRTAWLYAPNAPLFRNELWRLGGHRGLRGFDEERFQVDFFQLVSLETRVLLNRNSYAFAFFDGAYLHNPIEAWSDYPFGFGLGFALDTSAGLFSLSYALGQSRNEPLDIRYAKIHFGYINRF